MVKSDRKKLKKSRYVAAFIITLLVFSVGWLLGMMMDAKRVDYISSESSKQRLEYNSLQLQYQLINEITNEKDCEAILKTFESNVKNLENARIRLDQYQQNAVVQEDDFAALSREYSLAQIRYYLLAKKTQELCNNDVITILYFYSTKEECPNCEEQAFILTYLKKLIGDKLLVFSFNSKLYETEPTISILMNMYGIDKYPSVVINDKAFDYLLNKEDILNQICPYYDANYDFCE